VDIELKRPRTNEEMRLSPDFAAIRQHIWKNLQDSGLTRERGGASEDALPGPVPEITAGVIAPELVSHSS
jgi:hypothetical protein